MTLEIFSDLIVAESPPRLVFLLEKWRHAFECFVEGKGVTDPKQLKDMLLHCGGMELQDVYFILPAAQPEEDETAYSVLMKQLDDHFTPQVNEPYERHIFQSMGKLPDESID